MNSEYEIFTPVGFLWKKSAGYTVGDRGGTSGIYALPRPVYAFYAFLYA